MYKFILVFLAFFLFQLNASNLYKLNLISIPDNFNAKAKIRLKAWQKLVKQNKNNSTYKKLVAVNNFFNNIPYKKDIDNWGKKDYWATPIEFLALGSGDCEDYVIAKAYTLQLLGIKKNSLEYVYSDLILKKKKERHLVLSYFIPNQHTSIILDNVNKKLSLEENRKDLIVLAKFKPQALK